MAELLSHIVTEDGVDHRIVDLEAQAMVGRVQEQVGNINLADLDFELPTDPEFNTVKADESMSIGSAQISQNELSLLLDFINSATSIEGVYF